MRLDPIGRPLQRTKVVVKSGNLLETAGAGLASYGVYLLAGIGWSLVVGAAFLIVAAEFIYDAHTLEVPLPHLPKLPRVRLPRLAIVQRFRKAA